MSIVISPKVRLVVSTQDTTNFNTNSHEISILKEISLNRNTTAITSKPSQVSTSTRKVPLAFNTGYSGVNFSFDTYLKPIIDSGNVISAEKLLWESLSATDTTDTVVDSTISFFNGNTNKLRELYFYLIFDDGTYYKISRGVIASVKIDLSISTIAKATWEVFALNLEYITNTTLTGSPNLFDNRTFIRNKLSTIALNLGGSDYNLAVVSASFTISNSVIPIRRVRLGQLSDVSGHYNKSRTTSLAAKFYLDDKTLGSSDLLKTLFNYNTLDTINTNSAITFSIGGSSSSTKASIVIPQGKIALKNPTVGQMNTVDIGVSPQESVPGAGDEIHIIYET